MRLAVLAEHWRGAAVGHENVMYLHTGRRIGLGLLFGGVPYRGSHAAAGELGGHPNSRWVAFQHVMDYAMAVDPGELRAPSQAALFAMRRADDGDDKAAAAFEAFARALAEGLVSLVTPLDPDLVVIGGSLAQTGARLTEPIRACWRRSACTRRRCGRQSSEATRSGWARCASPSTTPSRCCSPRSRRERRPLLSYRAATGWLRVSLSPECGTQPHRAARLWWPSPPPP